MHLPSVRQTLFAVASLAMSASILACGGDETPTPGTSATPTASAQTVAISLTDAGCDPRDLSLPAGPTTFDVSNAGTGAVTEFEILEGDTILGEVENIAPGIERSFSLTLKPGTFETYCPGGENERGTLTVTATDGTPVPSVSDPQRQAAVDAYRAFLAAQTAELVAATEAFSAAVTAGDVETAKALYPAARVPYERIEPVAEVFGDLDPAIDAREGDTEPGVEWTGFHRIEKALWIDDSAEGMAPVAEKLLADVKELQTLVTTVELEPATIANGAVELLNEVSASKITGEEERYSRIDLVDFAANVEGSREAFEAVKPLLEARDNALAAAISAEFADVDTALAEYRTEDGYVLYTELTPEDTRKLSAAIDVLAESLSQVAASVIA